MKKNILLGISASIAAYKMPQLAHDLIKSGYDVTVMMTKNACEFITPYTFETLTQKKCLVDTFDRNFQYSVEHVSAAKAADLVLIAPASADVIGKLANGIADDMLTTTVMAASCQKIISPAMNSNMWKNPAVQDNIAKLQKYGWIIIPPESGTLANGDVGIGRMPEINVLKEYVERAIKKEHDLKGTKILVTAGATVENIDPVRYITNHSSGKMGISIAKAAMQRGAKVGLVYGKVSVQTPMFIDKLQAESAESMYDIIMQIRDDYDIIIMAAAVADFTPENYSNEKIKKNIKFDSIKLKKTKDILAELGNNKKLGQFVCGFAMETEKLIENAKKKLQQKNLDMICANSLKTEGAGFGTDTNVLSLITKDSCENLPVMSKYDAANAILDKISKLRNESVKFI